MAGFPYVAIKGRVFEPAALDHPFPGLRHAPFGSGLVRLRRIGPGRAALGCRSDVRLRLSSLTHPPAREARGGKGVVESRLRRLRRAGALPPARPSRLGAGRLGALPAVACSTVAGGSPRLQAAGLGAGAPSGAAGWTPLPQPRRCSPFATRPAASSDWRPNATVILQVVSAKGHLGFALSLNVRFLDR